MKLNLLSTFVFLLLELSEVILILRAKSFLERRSRHQIWRGTKERENAPLTTGLTQAVYPTN